MKEIPWLLLIVIWLVNFGISWWNAYACGKMWVETKHIGGWQRFMNWMGAIMSASGFTWCYMIILLFGAYYAQSYWVAQDHAPILTPKALMAGFSIGYLILIPGILFSGLMIWLDSLIQAWRRRDLPSMGIAAWNTYAQIHNTYNAYSGISGAFSSISDYLKSDDDDDGKGLALLVIAIIVAMSIAGGVFTTIGIIRHYAGRDELPERPSSRKHQYA
jgi:hypothetical protein